VTERLLAYAFPGNVRELENLVEQAVALCTNGVISVDDILPEEPRAAGAPSGRTLADIVDEAQRQAIEIALRGSDGSRERAAELLDISPTTLWRKMTRLGIDIESR
jgi:two-component system, NtrC family, response regulator HydG